MAVSSVFGDALWRARTSGRAPRTRVYAPALLALLLLSTGSAFTILKHVANPRLPTSQNKASTVTVRKRETSLLFFLAQRCDDEQVSVVSGDISFVIERLPEQPNEMVFREISAMCIQAFFNDDADPQDFTPPWKEAQLAYLRALQQGDLRRRRRRQADSNIMLVARRVIPCDSADAAVSAARHAPLILDLSRVYNLPLDSSIEDYVRGEVLGFVEVTKKPYGLGNEKVGLPNDNESKTQLRKLPFYNERPVLTNLSVRREARKSGLGSKLLEACEKLVIKRWGRNEIILEVEEDNEAARAFYERRGYQVLFEDPTSRRYDLSGLWLRQVRCKRYVMRKILGTPISPAMSAASDAAFKSTVDLGMQALRSLKENMASLVARR